jgi:putative transposase
LRYLFIKEQEKAYPIKILCKVMQVSRSCYYEWRNSKNLLNGEQLKLQSAIQGIFVKSRKTYGSRRLVKALAIAGYKIGRYQVRSIMKKLNLEVRYPKRFRVTTDSQHTLSVEPNLLNRQFNPEHPNQVWTTDLSYIWTNEGWIYLAVVIDLFSRQVVGWAIDKHMKTTLCIQALQMAYWRKKPKSGLLHHSDRGVQYASGDYRQQLKVMGMKQSMSAKGDCWDNSPTERFFRSLKSEHLSYDNLKTKEMAKLSIIDYIAFYNAPIHK